MIKPYISKNNITIYQGCALEVLKEMEDKSVDTIITDPPYGLSFMGKKWDYDVPSVEMWQKCLKVLKPGGTMLVFAGSRTQHRMAVNIEDAGFILKDCIMWIYGSGFPKATDISKQLDKKNGSYIEGNETVNSRSGVAGDNGNYNHSKKITKFNPNSEKAQLWNGWKSHGLKPAYEPILVCMKSNDGTYADNALKWDVSGLNIDGGKIPLNGDKPRKTNTYGWKKRGIYNSGGMPIQGRFPANIILEDGVTNAVWSRFFYCAKASKAERNMGCEDIEARFSPTMNDGIGIKEHNPDTATKKHKHHPTVKPLKLMEYLCTLTKTPTGGIVFDPFMGSGTTGIACKNIGREFVGCEIDKEYFEIAVKRLS